MTTTAGEHPDDRILIFAPVGKDASLTLDVLQRTHLKGFICATASTLCTEFLRGAAVVVLTEEALEDPLISEFMDCLRQQPAWSDIPILVFADAEHSEIYLRTLRLLEGLRNVILLERPIRLGAVLSLLRSAIRGRRRQYELRDLLKELARAREEAETANRLKDEFLATLSHELRTPLNAILGWTTMLRDGHVQPRQVVRALNTIHRNAMAQVQIVNDLLDVSRIVRGTVQLAPKTIAVGPLVSQAVESIMPAAEAKGVRMSTAIDASSVCVRADSDRLQQVLWNLLSNAVKFTPTGGRVDVTVRERGGEVEIIVTDTGIGIAPAFLPHVFERFRQGDGSSTRSHGGLGLGLSIAHRLVELHGGRMTAESEGEGRGATFTVVLPARVSTDEPAIVPPEHVRRPQPRRIDLNGTHVLIVDDETDARELLRAMLADCGARISEADSGRAALAAIRRNCPDVVLADVAMPFQDGYSLVRDIRNLPGGSRVCAIAVSAYARREDRQHALAAGFDDHLCKPVQANELYDALARARPQQDARPQLNG